MRASELLRADVVDADGHTIGRVRDLQLVRDGPALGLFGAGYRVRELLVGTAAIGTRLGFFRGVLRRPVLIAAAFRALERHAVSVRWEQVADITPGRIRLHARREELPPLEP